MFKALMRVQLASVIASLMRSSKGNEKRSAAACALIAVLFVFVAAVLVFAFGAMFYALAAPMHTGAGLVLLRHGRAHGLCALLHRQRVSPPSSSFSPRGTTSSCSPCR